MKAEKAIIHRGETETERMREVFHNPIYKVKP